MIVILSADTLAARGGGVGGGGLLSNPGNSIAFYRGTSLPKRTRLKVLVSWHNWTSPHPTTVRHPKSLASIGARYLK